MCFLFFTVWPCSVAYYLPVVQSGRLVSAASAVAQRTLFFQLGIGASSDSLIRCADISVSAGVQHVSPSIGQVGNGSTIEYHLYSGSARLVHRVFALTTCSKHLNAYRYFLDCANHRMCLFSVACSPFVGRLFQPDPTLPLTVRQACGVDVVRVAARGVQDQRKWLPPIVGA